MLSHVRSVTRALAEFPRTVRGLRIVQVAVVASAVATAGTGTYLATEVSQSTAISADAMLAEFRDAATPSPDAAGSPPAGSADGSDVVASEAPVGLASVAPNASDAATAQPPAGRLPSGGAGDPTPNEQPSTAEPTPVPTDVSAPTFGMPAEGVYTYVTEGWETVSMAGARHDYPSETFAAVRHLGGCRWETDHRFLEEHRERKEYCSDGSALLALGFDSYITFFGQTAESHGRCDPPQVSAHLPAEPGQRYTSTCAGDGWTSDAVVTFVGRESVVIAGQPVEALHYTQKTTLQGSTRGESDMDVWYHPETGLPLEVNRRTRSFAQAFGGEVEYNEDVHFVLGSLDPQR